MFSFFSSKNKKEKPLSEEELYNLKVAHDLKYDDKKLISEVKKDEILLLKTFVESEDEALKYKFQGAFYPMWHYQIKDIAKKRLKNIDEIFITRFFYHCFRLNNLYNPHPENFDLYKKAYQQLLPLVKEQEFDVCSFSIPEALLVFDTITPKNEQAIHELTHSNFLIIRKFITKVNLYTSKPAMRDRRDKLLPFLNDTVIMNRIQKNLTQYFKFHFDNVTSGSLILLLLSDDEKSKAVLKSLHTNNLHRVLVWNLGSFYKDFNTTQANQNLLTDLYKKYPKDWIDEYKYIYFDERKDNF